MADRFMSYNIFDDAIPKSSTLFPFQIKDSFTIKDDECVGEAGLKGIFQNP